MSDSTQKPNRGLKVHRLALETAVLAVKLVKAVPAPLKSVADQVVRSATSVPANLAEGAGRSGRDRHYHWRIAYASAQETISHLELLKAVGAIDDERAREAIELIDRVCAMSWRLMHPKP